MFPVYSITKAFTGVAVVQLVEAGKLERAAPVSRYLEGLPQARLNFFSSCVGAVAVARAPLHGTSNTRPGRSSVPPQA